MKAASTAAVGLGAVTFAFRCFGTSPGLSLAELEAFALKSQEGQHNYYSGPSTELQMYEVALGMKYARFCPAVREGFGVKDLIVADMGGGSGTAAEGLNRIEGVRAFNIDCLMHVPPDGEGLPRERHIVKAIEETALPDQTFHHLLSFNAAHCFKMERALPEIYRLLKVGGSAVIDLEMWGRELPVLESFENKENVFVSCLPMRGFRFAASLEKFIEFGKQLRAEKPAAVGFIMPRLHIHRMPLGEKIPDIEKAYLGRQAASCAQRAEHYVRLLDREVAESGALLADRVKRLKVLNEV